MFLIGKNYVLYINNTYRQTGTLWEGWHKASLNDAEHYLLNCYRYIELNPIRAAMTTAPEEYPWSSYTHHAWGKENDVIEAHERYHALATTDEGRHSAYRDLIRIDLHEQYSHQIRQATDYNFPLGTIGSKNK